ncbi:MULTISPECIES: phosphonate ABC transporter, permease protein PhnE [Vagococcus]|uniref:Phosphonate ABC transporter permease protein phnE2 (TC 3.A.1.9.1) n=1 Tax=Vagococcus fluvialis bH819 TaxID=1255619 RepID=A0A1X6WSA1_9ENTE|nr:MULTISPECIES: phosphonate ABC transporter, permease protein PhnE [Vagococcus]SLM87164.1 Phosphonate ABC transporter permease protein phnE2 (TC 3.A.1.9.1) [Vagococcus fluvialis bH819]HCM90024.1 phosphonate ABC transporter, permease protein PhnE [Vagococcus sp.]
MDNFQLVGPIELTNKKQLKKRMTFVLSAFVIGYSFVFLEVNPIDVMAAFPSIFAFLATEFLPPNFDNIAGYLPLILETVLFAVVGTYISAILAFIFGLLMAEEINPIVPVRIVTRVVVSFIRNIPVLVWASLLVYIFGIGNMVGLLALIIATFGFLTRSYAEEMNHIAGSKLEALEATGASKIQIIIHGLLPEFYPSWINWTLFSFEINIRASAILGMVGAGGIGIMIQTNIRLFNYQEASALILILVVMILLIEFAVNRLRRHIL